MEAKDRSIDQRLLLFFASCPYRFSFFLLASPQYAVFLGQLQLPTSEPKFTNWIITWLVVLMTHRLQSIINRSSYLTSHLSPFHLFPISLPSLLFLSPHLISPHRRKLARLCLSSNPPPCFLSTHLSSPLLILPKILFRPHEQSVFLSPHSP